MPVILDAVTVSGWNEAVSSSSYSVTVGSQANLEMVVTVGLNQGSTPGGNWVTNITYNGVALAAKAAINGPSGNARAELWHLTSPATGAHTLATQLGGNNSHYVAATVCYGVNQANPLGTAGTNSGSTTTPTVTVNGEATGFYIATVEDDGTGTLIVDGGETQQWNATSGTSGTKNAGSSASGASSQVMNWTSGSGASWAMCGICFLAAVPPVVSYAKFPKPKIGNAVRLRI